MNEQDPLWDGLKERAKHNHAERVSKTPCRIAYAEKLFKQHEIEYALKNPETGHFHAWRKADRKLFQFYAGTGKIRGEEKKRGIHAFVKLLEVNKHDNHKN